MNRKPFLNLTARADLFLELKPSLISCLTEILAQKEIISKYEFSRTKFELLCRKR